MTRILGTFDSQEITRLIDARTRQQMAAQRYARGQAVYHTTPPSPYSQREKKEGFTWTRVWRRRHVGWVHDDRADWPVRTVRAFTAWGMYRRRSRAYRRVLDTAGSDES